MPLLLVLCDIPRGRIGYASNHGRAPPHPVPGRHVDLPVQREEKVHPGPETDQAVALTPGDPVSLPGMGHDPPGHQARDLSNQDRPFEYFNRLVVQLSVNVL